MDTVPSEVIGAATAVGAAVLLAVYAGAWLDPMLGAGASTGVAMGAAFALVTRDPRVPPVVTTPRRRSRPLRG